MRRQGLMISILLLLATPAAADIKIGINIPSTGAMSVFGVPMTKSIPLLPKTIAGQNVTYVVLDSNSDPTRSAANTRKLIIDEKVDVLVGEVTTPGTLAMIDIAAEGKTPLVAPTAIASIVTPLDDKKRWVFKALSSDNIGADLIVAHMSKHGIKTVGMIGYNDAYGQSWVDLFNERFPKLGLSIVASEFFGRADTTTNAQTLKLLAAKPEAIFVGAGGTPASIPVREVRQRGFKGAIYLTHGVASREFIDRAGKEVNGAIFPSEPFVVYKDLPTDSPWRKMAASYIAEYQALNGSEPPIFGALIIDAVELIKTAVPGALARAQPGTPEFRAALRDSLEQVKDVYLNTGLLSNSPTNHDGFDHKGMFMTVIEDDQFRLLKD